MCFGHKKNVRGCSSQALALMFLPTRFHWYHLWLIRGKCLLPQSFFPFSCWWYSTLRLLPERNLSIGLGPPQTQTTYSRGKMVMRGAGSAARSSWAAPVPGQSLRRTNCHVIWLSSVSWDDVSESLYEPPRLILMWDNGCQSDLLHPTIPSEGPWSFLPL